LIDCDTFSSLATHKEDMDMFRKALANGLLGVGLATGVAFASPSHSPGRLSDAQYVAAGRCQALMASARLGPSDTHAIDAFMRAQERGRTNEAYERADQARQEADRQARTAGGYEKSQLIAERDGVCQALLASGSPTHGD
jgi:hypothetical protein